MVENTHENQTFKYGNSENSDYLRDDFLKQHAKYKLSFLDFARDEGLFDETSLSALSKIMEERANAVREGKSFTADGRLEGETQEIGTYEIKNPRRYGLKRKDRYVSQDFTEWAIKYFNRLMENIKPHTVKKSNTNGWDIDKHGFSSYLTGQGLTALDVFEQYDKKNPNNPTAARSFSERKTLLLKHLPKYVQWLQDKGFDFKSNSNEWDDNFESDFGTFYLEYSTSDNYNINDLRAALRKFGAKDYAEAFTSDRWERNKPVSTSNSEDLEALKKKTKEEEEKLRQQYLKEALDDFLNAYKPTKGTYLGNTIDYSNHKFKKGVTPSFMNYYSDLSDDEKKKYGTDLGIDSANWDNAYQLLMESLRKGTNYNDANKGIILQRYFEDAPNGFTDVGGGYYLINESVNDMGLVYVYDPKSHYLLKRHISEFANTNDDIKREYLNLLYKYINRNKNTSYDNRTYVSFELGGIIKAQLGTAVLKPYNVDDAYKELANVEGIDVQTQRAKNQYINPENKSHVNQAGAWDAPAKSRVAWAALDLLSALSGFAPGAGTIVSGASGFASTIGNFVTDLTDDAVTSGEMWKNFGLNIGMDLMGLIPGGGAATKFGKIVKTIKPTVSAIVALPGVVSLLLNSPEIAQSWKKAFDGSVEKGGSKMTYQDYMNILQVLNVATGGFNIAKNLRKTSKYNTKQSDKLAVEVFDGDGKRKALVLEGDDVDNFKAANKEGKAQEFLNTIEGASDYKINEVKQSNNGKFWGKDANNELKLQNPFGKTSTGKARVLEIKFNGKDGKYYAESGRWDADLFDNDLITTKGKVKLDDWIQKQQTDLNALFSEWRQKAQKFKTRTDKAAQVRSAIDADIETKTNQQNVIKSKLEQTLQTLNELFDKRSNIQEWLDNGGVNTSKNVIKTAKGKITRLKKLKSQATSSRDKRDIKRQIAELEAIINEAESILQANTPEAVLAAEKQFGDAAVEKSNLEIETAKLQALLDNLNKRRSRVNTMATTHSDAYNSIKDFKAIKKRFNGKEYTFDVESDLKNLDGLYKQGGSINKNKMNKFLNYAKG